MPVPTPHGWLNWLRRAALGLMLALPLPAMAGDDDELDLDDEEEGTGKTKKTVPSGDDDSDPDDPTNDDDWKSPGSNKDEIKLDDSDEVEVRVSGPGMDNAKIYREYLEKVKGLPPDEESLAWEKYLKKYPNSTFKSRIDTRMEELSAKLYDSEIETKANRNQDAGKQEIRFAQPMLLESIDPRSKIRLGFEWGRPDWAGGVADLEYQLWREFSVHGGLHTRFTGPNLEAGVKYAIIKSARTRTLVTALGDLHLGLNPVAPGIRPQIAAGQRFNLGDSGIYLDAMVQGGADMIFQKTVENTTMFSPRTIGGANVTLGASETVHVYAETSVYMKGFGHDELSSFRFNQVAFGMRFTKRKSTTRDLFTAGIGAATPYSSNYWGYHFGAVNGDAHYFLK